MSAERRVPPLRFKIGGVLASKLRDLPLINADSVPIYGRVSVGAEKNSAVHEFAGAPGPAEFARGMR